MFVFAALLRAGAATADPVPPPMTLTAQQDRQLMLDQLKIPAAKMRPGPNGSNPWASLDQPRTRIDPNSQTAHRQLLEKATKGRIDIYFVGDSITRRWGATDYPEFLANWKRTFYGWNAANFGWGGDTIPNILWRLQNGELDQVNPKIIVILAGTNNLAITAPGTSDEEQIAGIVRGIRAILDVCRQKAPKAVIVLMGITPRNDKRAVMATINQINERIARFADGQRVRYLNINGQLADHDGVLRQGMSPDGLHFSVKAYQVWADALRPIFRELLGPPAKEDLAPPPTGDPSAGAGLALHQRLVGRQLEAEQTATLKIAANEVDQPKQEKGEKARTDRSGDPLPGGALTRLGTLRWRAGRGLEALAFASDGKTVALRLVPRALVV